MLDLPQEAAWIWILLSFINVYVELTFLYVDYYVKCMKCLSMLYVNIIPQSPTLSIITILYYTCMQRLE